VSIGGQVHDPARRAYLQAAIGQVLRAKREGVDVGGYFSWSLTDNFEWAEGYGPRFGLIHVDYETQERIVKDSGLWYRDFLGGQVVEAGVEARQKISEPSRPAKF
jgi:beta-glucosidase